MLEGHVGESIPWKKHETFWGGIPNRPEQVAINCL